MESCAALALSLAAANTAAAQETEPVAARDPIADRPREVEQVYPAEFYAPYPPQTALDMLQHTPGFTRSEERFSRQGISVSLTLSRAL